MVAMCSQGCLNDGTTMARSCSLEFFGRFLKNGQNEVFERMREQRFFFSDWRLQLGFLMTENDVYLCCFRVQIQVHENVGCGC